MKKRILTGCLTLLAMLNCCTLTHAGEIHSAALLQTSGRASYAVTVEDTAEKISLTECKLSYKKRVAYDGTAKTASIRMVDPQGKVLKKDVDYTIVYKDNVNLGYATFVLNGIGQYTGSIEKTFWIYIKAPVIESVIQSGFYSNLITWNSVPGAVSYKIQYKTSEMSAYKTLKTGIKGTSYEHVSSTKYPLKGGITVTYKIIGLKADGKSNGFYTVNPVSVTMKTAKNGLKKESGRYHYYINNVKQTSVWKTVNGKTYYFNKYGNANANGAFKIGGVWYVFGSGQYLLKPAQDKIYTINDVKYYVSPTGKAVSGWKIISDALYHFGTNGKMSVNTTIDHIKFSSTGKAVRSVESELKIKCMNILSSITNSSMSKSQKLYAAWNYVTGGRFYYNMIYPDLDEEGWQRKLALNMLTYSGGNCYGFACTFSALAAEIGYDPYVVCARVAGTRDGADDGMTRHAWVLIDGLHYDPEADFAGWMPGIYGEDVYWYTHRIQKYQRFTE